MPMLDYDDYTVYESRDYYNGEHTCSECSRLEFCKHGQDPQNCQGKCLAFND